MSAAQNSMPTIRPFNRGDVDGVAALILPIQQHEFGIPISLENQPDLQDIASFYQHGGGNFWVAEHDGTVVGTIALLDIGNRQAALRKMFVASAFRGSAHGVAMGLLDALTEWALGKGVAEIYLGTTDRFAAAHRFYEKNGFKAIARSALPSSFPIMQVDSRFYTLALGDREV